MGLRSAEDPGGPKNETEKQLICLSSGAGVLGEGQKKQGRPSREQRSHGMTQGKNCPSPGGGCSQLPNPRDKQISSCRRREKLSLEEPPRQETFLNYTQRGDLGPSLWAWGKIAGGGTGKVLLSPRPRGFWGKVQGAAGSGTVQPLRALHPSRDGAQVAICQPLAPCNLNQQPLFAVRGL